MRSGWFAATCAAGVALASAALAAAALAAAAPAAWAQAAVPAVARRGVYVDAQGVMRWADTKAELALFGANYTLPSASDFRAAGYLALDRKRLVDDDFAHFARMGWTGVRLALWGDGENADSAGNLVPNEHLDLLDYALARARERGISVLFSPIQTYDANWPDALDRPRPPGFSNRFRKCELGTSDAAIAAQTNYLRQILRHVNPYTRTALKDEPAIVLIEMINEPCHHSADLAGSVRYIDSLAAAVRSTGAKQILFHNVSQDFGIAEAIRRSTVQGASFGWYPTALNSGHELQGSYLRTVDDYPPMRDPALAGRPRIVYEFDSADLRTGYMYPAMVRTFRAVGAQFAAMFAYDMLGTASRNLGWQTHYLSLAYTPRKAMSAVVAAEAMRRLPRLRAYGAYPQNTRFGDFRVSAEENLGELVAADAFLYAGTTRSVPPEPRALRRVAGYGSSPVVRYDGEGVYFLDRIRDGVWRLEVYPDAVPVRDPFEMPNARKIVTRAVYRAWPMTIDLPDLGATFTVQPLAAGNGAPTMAAGGRFTVTPGVYVASAGGVVDRRTLPASVGALRLEEFHAPPPDTAQTAVALTPLGDHLAGRPIALSAHVASATPPDSVTLWVRGGGVAWFRRFPMRAAGAYDYETAIPADTLGEGLYDAVVSVSAGDSSTTFPERLHGRPWDWDFDARQVWRLRVVGAGVPLRLLAPATDADALAFTRIGDAGRRGLFRVVASTRTGEPALHVELPVGARGALPDYTASLVVRDRVAARRETLGAATALVLRARGLGPRQTVHVTLVERDGTAWSVAVPLDSAWTERTIALTELRPARAAILPQGFPGSWSYWLAPPAGRGGSGDAIRLPEVERLQLSLRAEPGVPAAAGAYGVEVESVALVFR